jgi:hypothetical protein
MRKEFFGEKNIWLFQLEKASAAKTFVESPGNKSLFFGCERQPKTLTLGYIPYFTFKGCFTPGALFFFMLAHIGGIR